MRENNILQISHVCRPLWQYKKWSLQSKTDTLEGKCKVNWNRNNYYCVLSFHEHEFETVSELDALGDELLLDDDTSYLDEASAAPSIPEGIPSDSKTNKVTVRTSLLPAHPVWHLSLPLQHHLQCLSEVFTPFEPFCILSHYKQNFLCT